MARGLKLQRYAIENANHYHLRVFRLKVVAVEPFDGMTEYVFVYRRHPVNPYTGEYFDEFCGVASATDLAEYPIGAPDPNAGTHPFFLSDRFEIDLRSQTHYDQVWELIKDEVCTLITVLNLADNLVVEETHLCGDEAADSESASESSSESVSV